MFLILDLGFLFRKLLFFSLSLEANFGNFHGQQCYGFRCLACDAELDESVTGGANVKQSVYEHQSCSYQENFYQRIARMLDESPD